MRWFTTILMLTVALTMGGGCVAAHDRVSNGDRQLAFQNKSAAEQILDQAVGLQNTLAAAGIPAPAAALVALEFIGHAAVDIKDNSAQQIKNWGGEERIEGKADYSKEASATARKAAEEERARMTKWAAAIGIVMGVVGWLSKTALAAKIPFLGPILGFLNVGQRQQTDLTQTLQAGIDEARRKYDELAAQLRAKLDGGALEAVGKLIPTGDVLKERLETELARKGLLTLNAKIYEANPQIPEDPPAVVVNMPSTPAPA